MLTVHTFSSGSSGNAALVSCAGTHLLIDAGIACRRITQSLASLSLTPEDLAAVLVTHTHSDHVSGLRVLGKRASCPLFATAETCRTLREWDTPYPLRPLDYGETERIGALAVTPVRTSHDAAGCCGWRIDTPEGGVGILTDTGYITQDASDRLFGVRIALLEANHDREMLRLGPYPPELKARVGGECGHLCNDDAARFAVSLAKSGAEEIVLCHLSEENNTPTLALASVEDALKAAGQSARVSVAPRREVSRAYTVKEELLCSE